MAVIQRDLLEDSGRKEADRIVIKLFFLHNVSPPEILSIEILKFLWTVYCLSGAIESIVRVIEEPVVVNMKLQSFNVSKFDRKVSSPELMSSPEYNCEGYIFLKILLFGARSLQV